MEEQAPEVQPSEATTEKESSTTKLEDATTGPSEIITETDGLPHETDDSATPANGSPTETVGITTEMGEAMEETNEEGRDEIEVEEKELVTVNVVTEVFDEQTATDDELITIYKKVTSKTKQSSTAQVQTSKASIINTETSKNDDFDWLVDYLLAEDEELYFPKIEKSISVQINTDFLAESFSKMSIPPVVKKQNFKLNSNFKIPMVGFGTYHLVEQDNVTQALDWALATGYRLFDTAPVYKNQIEIGRALKILLPRHDLQRRDIFLTSKLEPRDHEDGVQPALEETLKDLKIDYLDLYLIHWPGWADLPPEEPYNAFLRDSTWAAMVEAKSLGLIRSIGVSNYSTRHLESLLKKCYGVKPAVNQIEWHPHCHDEHMRNICRQHGILIQGYYSLGGPKKKLLLKNKKMKKMAKCLEVTPQQFLLRWALQKNVAVIPRGRTKEQIEENMELDFEICCDCMKLMDKSEPMRFGRDPDVVY